jgi:hypothetical protein
MATFAVTAEHPPDLCPSSNAQTRQILIVDANEIESVRDFALQSRLMQWNTVKIPATYSIEEAIALLDNVETIS